jgi:hypothetical protein
MTVIVFMVAGMSSRFGGKPKQMSKVGPKGETLIQYSVDQAVIGTIKPSKIIFITNPLTEKLFFNIFGKEYNKIVVEYIEQKYDKSYRLRPWGTTDAICSVIDNIPEGECLILVNGDDIYGVNTFKTGFRLMDRKSVNIIGGLQILKTLPEKGLVNRGLITIDKTTKEVTGLKEMLNISIKDKKIHNELGNVNFMGLQKDVLKHLKVILDKFKTDNINDPKIECLLTDNLNDLLKSKKMKMTFFEITDTILGITNPGDENIVRKLLLT